MYIDKEELKKQLYSIKKNIQLEERVISFIHYLLNIFIAFLLGYIWFFLFGFFTYSDLNFEKEFFESLISKDKEQFSTYKETIVTVVGLILPVSLLIVAIITITIDEFCFINVRKFLKAGNKETKNNN